MSVCFVYQIDSMASCNAILGDTSDGRFRQRIYTTSKHDAAYMYLLKSPDSSRTPDVVLASHVMHA